MKAQLNQLTSLQTAKMTKKEAKVKWSKEVELGSGIEGARVKGDKTNLAVRIRKKA